MNKPIFINFLKGFRKIYQLFFKKSNNLQCIMDPEIASKIIKDKLLSDKPCMIARYGANELNAILNYKSIKMKSRSPLKYIKGEQNDWWWNSGIIKNLNINAGFFPTDIKSIEKFCQLMIDDSSYVDVLGSWIVEEQFLLNKYNKVDKVHIRFLEPFWSQDPWTSVLEGKKVLIVHPFVETIKEQYEKRDLLFNKKLIPDFELIAIKSVLSLANEKTEFSNWFDALNWMKYEIDKKDYDICLIGCGAYGFPLSAHVKRRGKKAIHLGGALQLLFGIKGKRWEDPNYGVKEWGIPPSSYTKLINEFWVRPKNSNKPSNAEKIEGACYW